MKWTLCHRVKHSFIISAKDTNNHHSVKLPNQVESQLVCFVWQSENKAFNAQKLNYQIIVWCSLFRVRVRLSQLHDMNPDWKGLWEKSRQMLTSDSQQFLVFGEPSRTKWVLAWWSRSTVYSCAWTPEKVNYGEECRQLWHAFSNVKVTCHPTS